MVCNHLAGMCHVLELLWQHELEVQQQRLNHATNVLQLMKLYEDKLAIIGPELTCTARNRDFLKENDRVFNC